MYFSLCKLVSIKKNLDPSDKQEVLMSICISLLGANGKMGKRILKLAAIHPRCKVVIGTSRQFSEAPCLQKIAGVDISMTSSAELAILNSDISIDFSSKETTLQHLEYAKKFSKPIVIGTTGHDLATQKKISETAQYIPIFYTPNFSPGIALLLQLVDLASTYSNSCCIDIIETHHIHKKDLPSGTALALAKTTGRKFREETSTERDSSEVCIHAIRSGEIIGEHQVIFTWGNEQIKLTHQALSRDVFAEGALNAAAFLLHKPAGLYSSIK